MQTPARPRGAYRGRHHLSVLVNFRPTWRQALSGGLYLGLSGSLTLALTAFAAIVVPTLLDKVAGTTLNGSTVPGAAWLAVLAPLPVCVLGGLTVGRRLGTRLDHEGVRSLPLAPDGLAPWALVVDVRAERRRRRTIVAVYLRDGSILRLRAPYDGELLGRDPQFERKLFMICHQWETHRHCRVPG